MLFYLLFFSKSICLDATNIIFQNQFGNETKIKEIKHKNLKIAKY